MINKNCIADKTECTTVSACSYCNLMIHLEEIHSVLCSIHEQRVEK